eukprot:CAMPEP_0175127172 /NCGR_PEP_ID=MMETSP0087-20121206/4251_1 /TAXON_ID=136419 /ORGANISM="Unknown Unknown, Strain D1" /LENGTH=178 /DNA_ID=CAMNT_0016409145 /DNA_START=186 /DNA_END=723 /DNA_ORIENTATION=-
MSFVKKTMGLSVLRSQQATGRRSTGTCEKCGERRTALPRSSNLNTLGALVLLYLHLDRKPKKSKALFVKRTASAGSNPTSQLFKSAQPGPKAGTGVGGFTVSRRDRAIPTFADLARRADTSVDAPTEFRAFEPETSMSELTGGGRVFGLGCWALELDTTSWWVGLSGLYRLGSAAKEE